MNYTDILSALNSASLFELYRLDAAIRNQLDDPARLAAVKKVLMPGQDLRYFDEAENRLIDATLLKVGRTRALVQVKETNQRWRISLYLIDLDGRDVEIAPTAPRGLDRNSVKVGDQVAFQDRSGQERFGRIVKLNSKTAGVLVEGRPWRVSYGLLSSVIEGHVARPAIPGEFERIPAGLLSDSHPDSHPDNHPDNHQTWENRSC